MRGIASLQVPSGTPSCRTAGASIHAPGATKCVRSDAIRSLCPYLVAAEDPETRRAFGDEEGQEPEYLGPVVHAMTDSRRPRSVVGWLCNPRGGAVALRDVVRGAVPLDHAALDEPGAAPAWSSP